MIHPIRKRIAAGFLVLGLGFFGAGAGAAMAADLHPPHVGTVAECEGPTLWHFVHNQTEAEAGTLTAVFDEGTQTVENGEPQEAAVLHYWVATEGNGPLLGASDDVEGGKLLLSHTDCLPPSTTTTTTTIPEETTTTIPEERWIDVELSCEIDHKDADTGAPEPILSFWTDSGNWDTLDVRFTYVAYDRVTGELLGVNEMNHVAPGFHDSWVDPYPPIPDTGFIVHLLKDNVLWKVLDDPTCIRTPETTTTTTTTTEGPEETTTTTTLSPECDEDHPTYNPETGLCELPFTGRDDLLPIGLFGAGMLAFGIGAVLAVYDPEELAT